MKLTRRELVGGSVSMVTLASLFGAHGFTSAAFAAPGTYPVTHSDAEWKKMLPPEAYQILRHEGTEAPFSSPLLNEHRAGTFACLGCGNVLYSSKTKFESGTGWPSFWEPISKTAVQQKDDTSLGMDRTEIHCSRCGGHQGHVFNDGPKPTGLRYCMNGASMKFIPAHA